MRARGGGRRREPVTGVVSEGLFDDLAASCGAGRLGGVRYLQLFWEPKRRALAAKSRVNTRGKGYLLLVGANSLRAPTDRYDPRSLASTRTTTADPAAQPLTLSS